MSPEGDPGNENGAPKRRRRRRRSSAKRRAALALEAVPQAPSSPPTFFERHRTLAIGGLASLIATGVVGISFASWWYADVNDFELEEASCTQAKLFFPIETKCRMTAHSAPINHAVRVTLEIDYDRTPTGWYPSFERIPSSGSSKIIVKALVPVDDGNLAMLSRPMLGVPGMELSDELVNPEPFWARLDDDPANAAFDAMVQRGYLPYGSTIVYVSGLRRLRMWKAATEVLSVGQMEMYNQEVPGIWAERLAVELDHIGRARLDPVDRMRYKKFLADLKRHPGWGGVLRELEEIQAAKAAGRTFSGAESDSRRASTNGSS